VKDVADAKYAEVDAKTKVRSESCLSGAGPWDQLRDSSGLSACPLKRALARCPCLTRVGREVCLAGSSSSADPPYLRHAPVTPWPCHPVCYSTCLLARPPACLTALQSVSADVLSKIDAWKVESEAVAGENARLREGVLALQRTLEATAAKHEAELRTRDIEVKVRPSVWLCRCPLCSARCWLPPVTRRPTAFPPRPPVSIYPLLDSPLHHSLSAHHTHRSHAHTHTHPF